MSGQAGAFHRRALWNSDGVSGQPSGDGVTLPHRIDGVDPVVQTPTAPVHEPQALRGDYSRAAPDYTVEQQWENYTEGEHAIWSLLYARQIELIQRYAAPEFLQGVRALGASSTRIPKFEDANRVLAGTTGWRIVAVPGLIPEETFFDHLAHRRFPVTVWIRRRDELDYLV